MDPETSPDRAGRPAVAYDPAQRAHRRRRPERLRRSGRRVERRRRCGGRPVPQPRDRPGTGRRRARRLHPGLASRSRPRTSPRTAASGRSTASRGHGAPSSTPRSSSTARSCARAPTARTATPGSRCAIRRPGRPRRPSSRRCSRPMASTRVVIGGLATDYCVKATALDAVRIGYADDGARRRDPGGRPGRRRRRPGARRDGRGRRPDPAGGRAMIRRTVLSALGGVAGGGPPRPLARRAGRRRGWPAGPGPDPVEDRDRRADRRGLGAGRRRRAPARLDDRPHVGPGRRRPARSAWGRAPRAGSGSSGSRSTIRSRSSEFAPPHRFAIRHLGAFSGNGLITLDTLDGGRRTRIEWAETLVPPVLPNLGSLVQAPILGRIFQADLERLKALVEGARAADRPDRSEDTEPVAAVPAPTNGHGTRAGG